MSEEEKSRDEQPEEAVSRREAESEKRLDEAERKAERASKRAEAALEELEHDGAGHRRRGGSP